MGMPVVTVATGGMPVVESTNGFGTPVTEAANGYGVPVTKVVGAPGLPVIFETIGVGGGTENDITWNAADKASGITLLDNNREAWHESGSNQWVRVAKPISTGKYCWAFHCDNTSTWRTGIATAAFNVNGDTLGSGTTSVSINNSGVVLYNGATLADYTDYIAGDYVLIAFDATAGDIWFGRNATWNGNPAAGTGAIKSDVAAGPWYPIIGGNVIGPNGKWTLVKFPTTVPAGFTALKAPTNADNKHWETVHFQVLNALSGAWGGTDLRQLFTAAQLPDKTGSKIRVRLRGGNPENAQVSAAHIGHAAVAGDVYDMDGTQVPLTIGGTNAFTIMTNTTVQSDEIPYVFNGTKGLLVNFHFDSTAADTVASVVAGGYNHYYKTTAAETGVSDVTTYTTGASGIRFVQEVQVYVDDPAS